MPYVEKRARRAFTVGPAGEEGRRLLRSLSAFFVVGDAEAGREEGEQKYLWSQ